MLERLKRQDLARTLQWGSHKDWEISTAALDQLIERASGRPGPGPGAQITLTAEQVPREPRRPRHGPDHA